MQSSLKHLEGCPTGETPVVSRGHNSLPGSGRELEAQRFDALLADELLADSLGRGLSLRITYISGLDFLARCVSSCNIA